MLSFFLIIQQRRFIQLCLKRKELLEIIPENNWMLSLPEYYTRYPFFYTSPCFLNADGVIPYILLNAR